MEKVYMVCDYTDSKASSIDNISMLMIKKCASHIAPVISTILNRSLQSSILPACWKRAVIHPVYKKRNQDDMANYRPIAALPALAKIFEKLLHQQMSTFLCENDVLCNNQFGFRKHICLVNLLYAF